MSEPKPYRVLVPRPDGGHEFVDATRAQYLAYCAGDPAWRAATDDAAPSLAERAWRRIAGRRTP